MAWSPASSVARDVRTAAAQLCLPAAMAQLSVAAAVAVDLGAVEDLEPTSSPPWSSNKTRTSKNNGLRNESRTCLDNDSMRGNSVTICISL
jgi:hypothetical protein